MRYSVKIEEIIFGGLCMWCAETVFHHLNGVIRAVPGWVSPKKALWQSNESIKVSFLKQQINLYDLVQIALFLNRSADSSGNPSAPKLSIYFQNKNKGAETGYFENSFQPHLQLDEQKPCIVGQFEQVDEQYRLIYFRNPNEIYFNRVVKKVYQDVRRDFANKVSFRPVNNQF